MTRPAGYGAEFRCRVATAVATPAPAPAPTSVLTPVVTEGDLDQLPPPVAAYVRRSGAVGRPRIINVRVLLHGRIRAGAAAPWMPFTAEQVNTFGADPSRLFFLRAKRFGLPVEVLHVYLSGTATMRVKLCSILRLVNAAGPVMDRSETVTLFNDLSLFAPSALIDAPITWQPVDAHRVRGTFVNGAIAVTADLTFNDDHELIGFCSDDRSRASNDGKTATPQRWSTPVGGYRTAGSQRTFSTGSGRWHAPAPEGEFAYLELLVDHIAYNIGPTSAMSAQGRDGMQPALPGALS